MKQKQPQDTADPPKCQSEVLFEYFGSWEKVGLMRS